MLPTNPLLNATAPAGPHLPVSLLRQYAAGTLAPAAQHRVEAHTLACTRCADMLAGLQQTPPASTDQALAQLQQRLRQRVQQQVAPARRDREDRRNPWLILQLAAAAALLLGLVAGGWWAWQQRAAAPRPSQPVAVAPATPGAERVAPASPVAVAPAPETLATTLPARPAVTAPSRKHYASRPLAARKPALAKAAPAGNALPLPMPPAAPPAAPAPAATPLAKVLPLPADSTALAGRTSGVASSRSRAVLAAESAPATKMAMPAAPAVAPAPAGGYAALREKLRRAASEFVPEAPEGPLSGTVQLRLIIGADGKIQKISVLRGLRPDYDAEAQRLVCEGPGWIPGISGGRRAALEVDVAVPF